MNNIPRKTAEKLATPFPKGTRHQKKLEIAYSLLGSGLPPSAIVATLKAKFTEASDKEIIGIVDWCTRNPPTPSPDHYFQRPPIAKAPPLPKPKPPTEHAAWWLSGETTTMEEFTANSHLLIDSNIVVTLKFAFEMLYQGQENICIVTKFGLKDDGKTYPDGAGRILTRDAWLEYFEASGIPESKAGAWIRPNPVAVVGSGKGGAVTDSDVTSYRYLLVESDSLPITTQLALYAKFKLSIAAVILSGGESAHAWVRLDCKDSDEYDAKARRILAALAPFGFDQANKNPSRLSRLPCATRSIGAVSGGLQKLLWLNPAKPPMSEVDIEEFEESLLCPAIEEKPFQRLLLQAMERYEDIYKNRGKLGVPTGFSRFDSVTGGLKAGGYTLIAASTGVGKSTIALNIINSALKADVGVVLFTLEMSADDVTDMMFSLNCDVDRNKFNTGEFSPEDIAAMSKGAARMVPLPFYLEDDPAAGIAQIRRRVLSLKSESRIGLCVIDYAQLVTPEVVSIKREENVAAVALELRLLSRQANIPVVVLSQLNDEGKIRESRRLSHEAANVLILSRASLTATQVVLTVAKGRKIPSSPINLTLDAIHCRMTEEHPIEENDSPKCRPLFND